MRVMKQVQRITGIVAIVLWILAIAILVIAAMQHKLLGLLPIIAYNRPQNFVGWIVVFAVIFTIVRIFLNLFKEKE